MIFRADVNTKRLDREQKIIYNECIIPKGVKNENGFNNGWSARYR